MVTEYLPIKNTLRPWSKDRIMTKQTQRTLDIGVLVFAFVLAYLLRFDFHIPGPDLRKMLIQLPYVVALQCTLLYATGVYTFIWRYVGMSELKAFVLAGLWSALPVILLRIGLPDQYDGFKVPLSVIFISTLLAFGGTLGIRVMRRTLYERYERKRKAAGSPKGRHKKPVLLIGAGRAGMLTAKEVLGRGDIDLNIKGFVDDDPNKNRAVINGIKVLGTTEDLGRLVRELDIDHVIISIAQTSRQSFRRILDICEQIPVKVRTIPGLYEILQGKVKVSRIRDVQIEDLLGREPVQLDEENVMQFLSGKAVMVTGAGGSIGAELSRQIARFNPSRLFLVDRAEFALFNIGLELRDSWPELTLLSLVADVCDEGRMRSIFDTYRPQVILHAAAHKHVPMMEFNPTEAVKNNVLGTHLVGKLAGEAGVEVFVLISTDKAVRPTSVMGATKRIAELVVQDLNSQYPTRYVAVRFGNVIGSAGSVIPIFRDQIHKGGPVKVTHKDMKRYFMTIPEAAQLVLQAGSMGEGGEIFVLDMGEPVNILNLAKEIITLSGLKPFEDIDIVFSGLRAGEKLFEELDWAKEPITKTRHPKIFIGQIAPYPAEQVEEALARLENFAKRGKEFEMCQYLGELLPEASLEIISRVSVPSDEPRLRHQAMA
jgi:FlaA1/EpsC-like NDP-sugar epimerase